MYPTATTRFKVNRLREQARNSRRQAKTHEVIASTLEAMLTGEGDVRDETIYSQVVANRRSAQELWDDHNDRIAQLKALS